MMETEIEEEVISTLVLLNDQEYLLTVSRRTVLFSNWSVGVPPKVVTLELKPFLSNTTSAADHHSIGLPCVVTAPFTSRFQLKGPVEVENPCMIYLRCHQPLRYELSFMKPLMEESDFLWDNFQDQLVFQTRLDRIVVNLKATKSADGSQASQDSFIPRTLPSIKAPPLKVLDLIESNEQTKVAASTVVQPVRPPFSSGSFSRSSSFGTPRRVDSISESFHPAKKSLGDTLLSPIETPPSIRAPSPPVTTSLTTGTNTNTAVPLTTHVTNQIEAKAVILKMRARHAGSMSYTIHPTNTGSTSQDVVPEVSSELEQFHRLVLAAKEEVIKESNKAKNDLAFYKDVLTHQQQQQQQQLQQGPGPISSMQKQEHVDESRSKPEIFEPVPPPPLPLKDSKTRDHKQKSLPPKVCTPPGKILPPSSTNTRKCKANNQSDAVPSITPSSNTTTTRKRAVGGSSTANTKTPLGGVGSQSAGVKAEKPSKTKQRLGEAIRISKIRDMLEEFDDSDPEIDTAPMIPDEVSKRSSMIDLEDEEY